VRRRRSTPLLAAALIAAGVVIPAQPAAAATLTPAGQYQPLTSVRVKSGQQINPGAAYAFAPLGANGVPANGVSAVAFKLHGTSTATGFLQAYPSGLTPRPGTSSVNYNANTTGDNSIVSRLGSDGKIAIYNGGSAVASADIDVIGYYTASGAASPGDTFVPLQPKRILDNQVIAAKGTVKVPARGQGGVAAGGVTAVVAHVSVDASTTAGGSIVAYPGTAKPATATDLTFPATGRFTTQVTVPLAADGSFTVYSSAAANLWVEVVGYFQDETGTAAGSLFTPVTPARALVADKVANGQNATLDPGAVATGASAVLFNLTANAVANDAGTLNGGAVAVYADGAAEPVSRQLSYQNDTARWPTQQVSKPGTTGKVTLRNNGSGPVRLLADVLGFYTPVANRASGLPWNSGVGVQPPTEGWSDKFGKFRGADLDNVALFPPRNNFDWMSDPDWFAAGLPQTFKKERDILTVALPLWPYDHSVDDYGTAENWGYLADVIAKSDPDAYVRLGWEMNLPGQQWHLTEDNQAKWQAAFIKIVGWMKARQPGLHFVWNPNKGGDQTCDNDCTRTVFQAVKNYVDVYGVDSYDSWPAVTEPGGANEHLTSYGLLGESYQYAIANGKKFAVPEWGISCNVTVDPEIKCDWAGHAGGDDPAYIELYLDFFAQHAGDLAFESYFDEPNEYIRSSLIQNPLGPQAPAAYQAGIAANKQ
jgi:hypothetical protein